MQTKEECRRYLEAVAPFRPVESVPEISLHLHHAATQSNIILQETWEKVLSESENNCSLIAWPGGIWLARYILDHPNEFAGKKIIDIGTGSGLVAIACARVGGIVTATDIDLRSVWSAQINAEMNGASINVIETEWGTYRDYDKFDIITTADTFYDSYFAPSLFEIINRHPFILYAAHGSSPHDLHYLKAPQSTILIKPAELVSLQARTPLEIIGCLPTAIKIISPGPPALFVRPPNQSPRRDIFNEGTCSLA